MAPLRLLIVNCGVGNVTSVVTALHYLGADVAVSGDYHMLRGADAYILPGVGAFPYAAAELSNSGILEPLAEQVLEKRKALLGICLGMQLLATDSVEQRFCEGLGWVGGHVVPLEPGANLRTPHVGWNEVLPAKESVLFNGIDTNASFYFDHAFYLQCDPGVTAATFEYGNVYPAAIEKENIFATQFHPEKSQRNGLKLLRNFMRFAESLKCRELTAWSHG